MMKILIPFFHPLFCFFTSSSFSLNSLTNFFVKNWRVPKRFFSCLVVASKMWLMKSPQMLKYKWNVVK